jgi:hypothetical protein
LKRLKKSGDSLNAKDHPFFVSRHFYFHAVLGHRHEPRDRFGGDQADAEGR